MTCSDHQVGKHAGGPKGVLKGDHSTELGGTASVEQITQGDVDPREIERDGPKIRRIEVGAVPIAQQVDCLVVAGVRRVGGSGEEFVAVNPPAVLRRAGTPARDAHRARCFGPARQDGL